MLAYSHQKINAAKRPTEIGYFTYSKLSAMRFTLILLFSGFTSFTALAQNINWQWAEDAGGNSNDFAEDVTTDLNGNVYATGYFQSDSILFGSHVIYRTAGRSMYLVKFDPDGNVLWTQTATGEAAGYSVATDGQNNVIVGGSFSFTTIFGSGNSLSTGGGSSSDAFVAKYDASGNLLWAEKGGGPQVDYCIDLATDPAGNIYCTGTIGYQGVAVFGSIVVTNTNGVPDVYIAKYDPTGNCLWVDNNGGTCTASSAAIACDSSGAAYIVGRYWNSAISFNGLLSNSGGNDVFFVKYTTNGNVDWQRKIGASQDQFASDVATTNTGEVYVSGVFLNSSLNIGGQPITSNGGVELFIAKYDTAGTTLSAQAIGGTGNDYGGQLAVDVVGNVLFGLNFDIPTITYGTQTFSNLGDKDLVLLQLDAAGNILDAKHTGGADQEYFTAICYGPDGSMHACGNMQSLSANFDVAILGSLGNDDAFVGKLDDGCSSTGSLAATTCSSYTSPSGNYTWTSTGNYLDTIPNAGGCDSVILAMVTILGEQTSSISPVTCGSYTVPSGDETYAVSGVYTDTLQAVSGCDSIITVNLTVNQSTSGTLNTSSCVSYTVPSGDETYASSGTYSDTIANVSGCDSIISINLTVLQPTSSSISVSACDSYTVPSGNQTYFTSGTYQDIIPNLAGCDSVITINLSINNSSSNINASACDSYTVPSGDETYTSAGTYMDTIPNALGCDSIITINLTLESTTNSITVSACDTYTVPSQDETYTASGTYMDTIPNMAGCDSVITIQLTINTVEALATLNGATLTASPSNATYQWINCATGDDVVGETDPDFTPTVEGSYAVVVTLNGCVDTSACVDVLLDRINGFDQLLGVQLYPNPTSGAFLLDFANAPANLEIEVLDMTGRKVKSIYRNNTKLLHVAFEGPAGIYLITIIADGRATTLRLVKQ